MPHAWLPEIPAYHVYCPCDSLMPSAFMVFINDVVDFGITTVDVQLWHSHTSFLSTPLSSNWKSDFCWWCNCFALFLQNLCDFCCAIEESESTRLLIEDRLCGYISKIRFSLTLSMDSGVFDTSWSFGSSYRLAVFKHDMASAVTLSLPATCWNFILYCCSSNAHLSIVLLFIPVVSNGANGLWSWYKVHSAPVR